MTAPILAGSSSLFIIDITSFIANFTLCISAILDLGPGKKGYKTALQKY